MPFSWGKRKRMKLVTAEQMRELDRRTICDLRQGVAAGDDVLGGLGLKLGQQGPGRRRLVKELFHPRHDGLGHPLLVFGITQVALLFGIRDESGLDQDGRDIR